MFLLSGAEPTEVRYIRVWGGGPTAYTIRYRLPPRDAPWRDAYAEAEAVGLKQAVEVVVEGMEKSGGWQ